MSQQHVIRDLGSLLSALLKSPYRLQQTCWLGRILLSAHVYILPVTAFALQVLNVNRNVHYTHTQTHYWMKCLVCGAIHRCVPALGKESVVQITLLNVRWQQMYCTYLSYLLDCDVNQAFTFANVKYWIVHKYTQEHDSMSHCWVTLYCCHYKTIKPWYSLKCYLILFIPTIFLPSQTGSRLPLLLKFNTRSRMVPKEKKNATSSHMYSIMGHVRLPFEELDTYLSYTVWSNF